MTGRSGLAWPPETSLYNTAKAVIHSYSNDFADWGSDKPTNSFLRRSPERYCHHQVPADRCLEVPTDGVLRAMTAPCSTPGAIDGVAISFRGSFWVRVSDVLNP